MTQHVYYNEIFDEIVIMTGQEHLCFGVWFYPNHNLIWLGEL